MKHLRTVEKSALIVAMLFIAVGIWKIINPTEVIVPHPGHGHYAVRTGMDAPGERVTKRGARVYGFISVGMGVGLAFLALYRPNRKSKLN
jgi:hypothetical protein